MGVFQVGIFQVGVILGGNFPGGNCPGESYLGWELSGWELSWVEIFFGGDFPGENCPGAIIRVGIFRMGVFLVPSKHIYCACVGVKMLDCIKKVGILIILPMRIKTLQEFYVSHEN